MSTIRDIFIDNKGGSARHDQPAELLITMSLVSREFHVYRTIQVDQAGPIYSPSRSNSDLLVLGIHKRRCKIRAKWLSIVRPIAQYLDYKPGPQDLGSDGTTAAILCKLFKKGSPIG
jgi:hypothetical protein